MSAIVYALTNYSMPGKVKIGMTSKHVSVRMDQLYSTGVARPFQCAIAVEVDDQQAENLEKALHKVFAPSRPNPDREFFDIDASQVIAILSIWPGGKDVTSEVRIGDQGTLELKVPRRLKEGVSNPKFSEMGIPMGSILKCVATRREAIVTGEEQVTFMDDGYSLQEATKMELGAQGFGLTVQNPLSQWMFDGQYLSDICQEPHGSLEE